MRNYITHHYFRFNAEILQTDAGKKRIIKDFIDFSVIAKSVDFQLEDILDEFHKTLGMTDEIIASVIKAVKNDGIKFSTDLQL